MTPSRSMSASTLNRVVSGVCVRSVGHRFPFCLIASWSHGSHLSHYFHTDRATEANVRANSESSKTKLKLPVLAIGSEAFIGKEVHRQMNQVAVEVEYKELKFGHQLAEECPEDLAKLYLEFMAA